MLSEDETTLSSYEIIVHEHKEGEVIVYREFLATNVVTANNDGENDYWIVHDVNDYKDYTFTIFDANGRILLKSVGYDNSWDATYQGEILDKGSYYYQIHGEQDNTTIKGSILVLH